MSASPYRNSFPLMLFELFQLTDMENMVSLIRYLMMMMIIVCEKELFELTGVVVEEECGRFVREECIVVGG